MIAADRRAQFELATEAGRGRIALVEHRREAARRDDDIRKIARLNIGERVELPSAAPDEAQARFLCLARRIGGPPRPGAAIRDRHRTTESIGRGKSVSVRSAPGARRHHKKKKK